MALDDARSHIDTIDEEILSLLRQRAEVALSIGREKAQQGAFVFDPAREAQVLRRLTQLDLSPLEAPAIQAIYREIISACRRLQAPPRVAFLGPEHSFSHIAAVQRFGHGAEVLPAHTITDVFQSLQTGHADLGVVPIENSSGGAVSETMDCFAGLLESDLRVCGELYVPVHLFLMADCELGEVTRIYSHPQPVAQARLWLHQHLPQVEIREVSSTVLAAQMAGREAGTAAIGPRSAAEAYGLRILFANIQDSAANRTRFLVIGPHDSPATGRDKTSIVFSTAHRSGALYAALRPLADNHTNLTFIQSRPARGALWEYVFFVDIEGHQTDAPVRSALDQLAQSCPLFKVLGSYPAAE
jgi:chorismate mutase / prephenate dehydratase